MTIPVVDTSHDHADPTAPDRQALPYEPALDGIRALAVAAVIAYHNGYSWARGGFLGVDAFFVLSGFLITTLLVLEYRRAEAIGLVAFWGRRIRRLLPALILVLAFCALYGAFLVGRVELTKFRWDAISSVFYVTNWRFIASGRSYFDLISSPSPFRHLWSLAIEEQFYLVWPVVVLICLRVRRGRLDLLAGVCIAGSIASVAAMATSYDAVDPSRAYFGTDTRAHTLLVGALLALALVARSGRSASRRVLVAGQWAAGLSLVVIVWCWRSTSDTSRGYYGLGSLAYAIAVAIMIAAVLRSGGVIRRALSCAPLPAIGQISYGLYLWHWPIIVWLTAPRVGLDGSQLVALRLVVTTGAALLSYRFVEQPIRHGRWWARSSRRGPLAAAAAAGLIVVMLTTASVGAVSPPSYLAGAVGSCPNPQRPDIAEANRSLVQQPVAAPSDAPDIAVLGDSTACSLAPGLAAMDLHGWHTRLGAVIGCGEVSFSVLPSADVPQIPAGTGSCAGFVTGRRHEVTAHPVPVALLISTWERADIDDSGVRLRAGTPRWNAVMARRMDRVVAEFRARHTHLVIALMPSKTRGVLFGHVFRATPGDDRAFARLNAFWLQTAARHPADVSIVDVAARVCPGGPPCAPVVDGFEPRALDGNHFTPRGAAWLLQWMLPQVVASINPITARA